MSIFKLGAAIVAALTPALALAQEGGGIDAAINAAVAPVSNFIVSIIFYSVQIGDVSFPLIVGWLITAAAVCSIYFGFIQFRGVKHSLDLVRGRYADPNDAGEVSHFQALTTALSATVGLGNIAGVAVAVSIGGAGATFWMILAGLLGMASKFTECTLGVKFRRENADGTISGGPMYYLSRGFADLGKPGLGRALAAIFSVCCIGGAIGGGNMFQANQAAQQIANVTGGDASFFADKGWLIGLVLAVVVGMVIIGGLKSIAHVTEKIVPFMAAIYVGAGIVIMISNYDKIGWAFGQIVSGAFTGEGVAGGVLGALIQGFKRAAFSNEAGIGSAAIAHSAVRTKEPVTEGFVALLEPFIDTVVICTMTAVVIVVSGTLDSGLTGVELTSAAFATAFPWFPVVLAVAVVLFAFSTMISWSYYGLKATTYLFGENKTVENIYKLFFCICVVIGASMSLGPVIDFSDSMIFAMAIPNVIGLYLLMPVVKRELAQYQAKLASGEIKRFH
ncbi:alanine/glycine:cation symporter family protein [Denitromonas ohlonensis]|jgi:AGCS family alanine or glycine:cation symporter|uniref:Alanine:cation symporter family protein n=2 Tax=Denitromonas TaxID=139331 RepID=A0A558EQ10_9RHOO|nr:alanine/glycine:cation symporter family protein [Denitromonas ohlonensis]TVO67893.1 alanine:cation symporter family protein [Denitromonas ohlonensis]TVO78202.1 alanine:cation symporter family protein [Denitromonas ohlonensis]TVT47272.1 MAG: alanine:cation symporter family protein [Denitromonas halophila]TVT75416.1 MAG: alanine:cation symporter family protein [Denitromonas halophila]